MRRVNASLYPTLDVHTAIEPGKTPRETHAIDEALLL
jgi:hypothetical protein